MKKVTKKMNVLLSNLNIMYTKLHNYHYNVIGNDFLTSHKFLEDEYEIIHNWIDEVAEEIKKIDEFPLGKLSDYIKNSNIKEIDSKDYHSNEIYKTLVDDYKILIEDMEGIKKESSDTIFDLMNHYISILDKKIWIMNSLIK